MVNSELCGKRGEKPPYATGFLVDDYGPLFAYWRIARAEGREDLVEKAMIQEEDVDMLVELASNRSSLGELLVILAGRFSDRIYEGLALKAVQACDYKNLDSVEAQDYIAGILAGWLVELGESMGRIRFSTRREV
ncbi:MAG: hypothetical protein F7B59_00045 [Desulfurococcales archaeon]|nr:hypothetical protein [Desulfurococcales archaeon]